MALSFKDYFSKQAADYAKYRPHYPEAFFQYLAEISSSHEAAWDCGTGNGQVALGLTPYFQQIYATDASATQIERAFPHEKIQYQVAKAEKTQLADSSVELITVGQALHWFNSEQFYREVRRVAKPKGVLAVWCYGFFKVSSEETSIDRIVQEFYAKVEPFWPPETQLVKEQYQSIPFPFIEEVAPAFAMTTQWTVEHLIGYLLTWSSTQRLIEEQGFEAVAEFTDNLQAAWGDSQSSKQIQWPLYTRIGRLE